MWLNIFLLLSPNLTEEKGQERLSFPARLVRFGKPSRHVLFHQWGAAAQTGRNRAAGCSLGATRVAPSAPAGEAPGSLGEEAEEESGCEPLWSTENRGTPLTFCQGSQGRWSRTARTGPGRRCVQRDHQLLRRPPAGLTVQCARQSCQDEYCRPGRTRLRYWIWDWKVKSQEGPQVLFVLMTHFAFNFVESHTVLVDVWTAVSVRAEPN